MPADVRAELEYMAQHVTADEFRAAALVEVDRLQAELKRLCAEIELWGDYEGRVRDVVSEYVNNVESGEKFDALLALLEDEPAAPADRERL